MLEWLQYIDRCMCMSVMLFVDIPRLLSLVHHAVVDYFAKSAACSGGP